jgi:hypothetical protein
MSVLLQDPDERLDYQFDWDSWLADGDSIASRQWTITPTGPTLTNATSAAVTVSGMTGGITYHLTEKVTTANGIIGDRTIAIRCAAR